MKRIYCVFILLVISTGYLFPQNEENKIIKVDTVVRVDTVVVRKVDTVVIKKPVNQSEEKKDFIQYDFYNDYLYSLKENSDDKKTIGIFLLEGGAMTAVGSRAGAVAPYISISLKAPISENFHFIPRYLGAIGNPPSDYFRSLSFMFGQYFPLDENKNFLIEGSAGVVFFSFWTLFPSKYKCIL